MKHGTRRGYHQHLKRGEPACQPCLDANNQHSRDHWRRHHPVPDTVTRQIIRAVETNQPVHLSELPSLIPDADPYTLRVTAYRLARQGRIIRDGPTLTART